MKRLVDIGPKGKLLVDIGPKGKRLVDTGPKPPQLSAAESAAALGAPVVANPATPARPAEPLAAVTPPPVRPSA